MKRKAIFIAATGQNIGKTTLCLGIFAGLMKRFKSVGFMKPIGQRHVEIDGACADKDVILFKEYFGLNASYALMSPVSCPQGFTRDYLDQKVNEDDLIKKISTSFQTLVQEHPYVLVEGTGHVGVGSLFQLNNARCAELLGLDMVIIAGGGLGSSIDELALNIEMCRAHNVRVRGVIINRVLEDKRAMIAKYYPKALERFDVPLLGAVPYLPYLSIPMMKDFEGLLESSLLTGTAHRFRHFAEIRLIAGSLDSYLEEIGPNQLIITPACREDIIEATIERHRRSKFLENRDFQGGMILTGQKPPRAELVEASMQADLPILYAPLCSFDVMKMITSFCSKIQKDDIPKIERAIALVENYIDFDKLVGN